MPEVVECNFCGSTFEVLPYRADTAKYCSKDCYNKGRRDRISNTCKECGNEYEVDPRKLMAKQTSVQGPVALNIILVSDITFGMVVSMFQSMENYGLTLGKEL